MTFPLMSQSQTTPNTLGSIPPLTVNREDEIDLPHSSQRKTACFCSLAIFKMAQHIFQTQHKNSSYMQSTAKNTMRVWTWLVGMSDGTCCDLPNLTTES